MTFQTELAELPSLAADWEALNASGQVLDNPPFFQSFAWNYHVARIRSARSAEFRVLVATGWRGNELAVVWPLSLQHSAQGWLVRALDDPYGQFAGIAFRHEADVGPAVAAIVAGLRERADGMQIEAVISGSPLHRALLRCQAKAEPTQEAVFLDLRPFACFEDLARTAGSETRKTMRKRRNRLEREHGPVKHHVANEPSELRAVLRETFDGRLEWLKRNGRTSPAFRTQEFRSVVDNLVAAEGIELLATTVRIDDCSIASGWGFVYGGSYYDYMSAMNLDYSDYSPGKMKLGFLLEECLRRGIGVFEMLAPAMDYKLEWSDRLRRLETMHLRFSARARLAGGVQDWLVPRARRLSRMLPERMRRLVVGGLNRD